MNKEEKAKAYDEALERARKFYNDCVEGDNPIQAQRYVDIFPELRESEDERIRRYLIKELKVAKSVGELLYTIPQPTREECIAYLEKQKEQKPAEWGEEDEKFFQLLLAGLYAMKGRIGGDDYNKAVNRLKSLRPQSHGKPSEYTLSLVKKVANGEMLTHMEQMAMETLCNDLQKLL